MTENPEQAIRFVIQTEAGNIEIEVYPARAPLTVANFQRYAGEGYYDGGSFYRTVTPDNQPDNTVKIEVIQGGIHPDKTVGRYPPLPLERTSQTGLRHLDGTISMARFEPDSATSEFFICIGPQPELDFGGKRYPDGQGFAAFGRVTAGMELVRQIQHLPRDKQALTPPVKITGITCLD